MSSTHLRAPTPKVVAAAIAETMFPCLVCALSSLDFPWLPRSWCVSFKCLLTLLLCPFGQGILFLSSLMHPPTWHLYQALFSADVLLTTPTGTQ